ncbi:hypothetical protein MSSD14B_22000 [Marinobacter salsuginis]|uniref:Uncharacterized protein n=1 Tax=Marinobacter salsuginis TaxID=418719 RepID=A0A5M3Q0C7_9GAMM|nr:hypothetical protein MSSD14B_22000 [Marinobacter salsuginis]
MAVPTFPRKVVMLIAVPGKINAGIDQPIDALLAVLHGETYGVFVAKASASIQGVSDVVFSGILIIQDRSDSALRPEGCSTADLRLAHHADFQMLWQIEGDGEAGSAAADNENIVFEGLWHRVVIAGHNVDVY